MNTIAEATVQPRDWIDELILEVGKRKESSDAINGFKDTVLKIVEAGNIERVIEIGGGRSPLLSEAEIAAHRLRYTSNDISGQELSLAPAYVDRACFDVATGDRSELDAYAGKYELVFSRMVMEHVPDYESAYRNIATLLEPNGISIAFHPVLFSIPFVMNRLLPEKIGSRLLRAFHPHRHDGGTPKFPAYYSGCRISPVVKQKILAAGFREVHHIPFYGHGYYTGIPLLRTVHGAVSRRVRDADVRLFSTYSYTIARK